MECVFFSKHPNSAFTSALLLSVKELKVKNPLPTSKKDHTKQTNSLCPISDIQYVISQSDCCQNLNDIFKYCPLFHKQSLTNTLY